MPQNGHDRIIRPGGLSPESDAEDGLAGRRVLLVEDTFLVADEIARALRKLRCAVVGPFASVDSAAGPAKSDALDLGLLDINLDGQPVYPVAQELLARGIPFVFLTGYTGEAIDTSYRGFPRLTKPFGPAELHEAIRAALYGSSSRAIQQKLWP